MIGKKRLRLRSFFSSSSSKASIECSHSLSATHLQAIRRRCHLCVCVSPLAREEKGRERERERGQEVAQARSPLFSNLHNLKKKVESHLWPPRVKLKKEEGNQAHHPRAPPRSLFNFGFRRHYYCY